MFECSAARPSFYHVIVDSPEMLEPRLADSAAQSAWRYIAGPLLHAPRI